MTKKYQGSPRVGTLPPWQITTEMNKGKRKLSGLERAALVASIAASAKAIMQLPETLKPLIPEEIRRDEEWSPDKPMGRMARRP